MQMKSICVPFLDLHLLVFIGVVVVVHRPLNIDCQVQPIWYKIVKCTCYVYNKTVTSKQTKSLSAYEWLIEFASHLKLVFSRFIVLKLSEQNYFRNIFNMKKTKKFSRKFAGAWKLLSCAQATGKTSINVFFYYFDNTPSTRSLMIREQAKKSKKKETNTWNTHSRHTFIQIHVRISSAVKYLIPKDTQKRRKKRENRE